MNTLTTSHKIWVETRRNILLELMAQNPHKEWSLREIEEGMRNHPAIMENQPTYSRSTASLDLAEIRGDLQMRRAEIGDMVIVQQLQATETILEKTLTAIDKQFNELDEEIEVPMKMIVDGDGELHETPDLMSVEKVKDARIKRLNTLHQMIERAYTRQGKLLPIEVAKKIDLSPTGIGLAEFLSLRKKAEITVERPKLADPLMIADTIEGEYEDTET